MHLTNRWDSNKYNDSGPGSNCYEEVLLSLHLSRTGASPSDADKDHWGSRVTPQ